MAIKARIKTFTPKNAQNILDAAIKSGCINRKINMNKVDRYVQAMKNGEWKQNGQPITFDENGILMDGQHRLKACVLANIPMTVMVHENVERSTFDTFDCGVPRTARQVVEMAGGKKYATQVASIIHGVHDLRSIGHTAMNSSNMTNTQVNDEYVANAELYDNVAQYASKCVVESKCAAPKLIGTVAYYLIKDRKQPIEEVETFITGITSIESSDNAYINKLRRWLMQHRMERISDRTKLGYIILTWNAMVCNEKIPTYSEKNVEVMPSFITK